MLAQDIVNCLPFDFYNTKQNDLVSAWPYLHSYFNG